MKSLLKLAVFAVIGYAAWDLFGEDWMKMFNKTAGSFKEQLGVLDTSGDADFVVVYDGASNKFAITAAGEQSGVSGVSLDSLSLHLRSSSSHLPHVEVTYDPSLFNTNDEKAEFEAGVRRQVERAKCRASFITRAGS